MQQEGNITQAMKHKTASETTKKLTLSWKYRQPVWHMVLPQSLCHGQHANYMVTR